MRMRENQLDESLKRQTPTWDAERNSPLGMSLEFFGRRLWITSNKKSIACIMYMSELHLYETLTRHHGPRAHLSARDVTRAMHAGTMDTPSAALYNICAMEQAVGGALKRESQLCNICKLGLVGRAPSSQYKGRLFKLWRARRQWRQFGRAV